MFHHLLHLFKSFSSYIDVVYGRWRWSQEHLELSPSWKHQHEVKTKMTVAVFIVMLTRDRLTVRSESVLKCWIPNMIWFWSLDARPWLNCSILSFLESIETVSSLDFRKMFKLVSASAVVANDSVNAYLSRLNRISVISQFIRPLLRHFDPFFKSSLRFKKINVPIEQTKTFWNDDFTDFNIFVNR